MVCTDVNKRKASLVSYRLSTTLALFVFFGVLMAIAASRCHQARKEKRVVEWLLRHNVRVEYGWQTGGKASSPVPKWAREWGLEGLYQSVTHLDFRGSELADISPAGSLRDVRSVYLGPHVTSVDALRHMTALETVFLYTEVDLEPLTRLPQLRRLAFVPSATLVPPRA